MPLAGGGYHAWRRVQTKRLHRRESLMAEIDTAAESAVQLNQKMAAFRCGFKKFILAASNSTWPIVDLVTIVTILLQLDFNKVMLKSMCIFFSTLNIINLM